MKSPALRIIEEVYEMALNPTLSYYAQLQPLAPSGELADKIKLTSVVFKLCELVDKQAKEIDKLKEDRVQIATEMAKLQKDNPIASMPVDPTKPIV